MYKKALALAWLAHKHQRRWDGQMYIYHPIRVVKSIIDNPNEILGKRISIMIDSSSQNMADVEYPVSNCLRADNTRSYISHYNCNKALAIDALKTLAILHDIIEDTSVSQEVIRLNFGESILRDLKYLTHNKGEKYLDYIKRIKNNSLYAAFVKIHDIMDNLPTATPRKQKLYKQALTILQS